MRLWIGLFVLGVVLETCNAERASRIAPSDFLRHLEWRNIDPNERRVPRQQAEEICQHAGGLIDYTWFHQNAFAMQELTQYTVLQNHALWIIMNLEGQQTMGHIYSPTADIPENDLRDHALEYALAICWRDLQRPKTYASQYVIGLVALLGSFILAYATAQATRRQWPLVTDYFTNPSLREQIAYSITDQFGFMKERIPEFIQVIHRDRGIVAWVYFFFFLRTITICLGAFFFAPNLSALLHSTRLWSSILSNVFLGLALGFMVFRLAYYHNAHQEYRWRVLLSTQGCFGICALLAVIFGLISVSPFFYHQVIVGTIMFDSGFVHAIQASTNL